MKSFEEEFFAKEVKRVKISPVNSSIEKHDGNNILNVTLLPQEGDGEVKITMRKKEDYYSMIEFIRMRASELIEIEWLENPEEGCVFIGRTSDELIPCKVTIIS